MSGFTFASSVLDRVPGGPATQKCQRHKQEEEGGGGGEGSTDKSWLYLAKGRETPREQR